MWGFGVYAVEVYLYDGSVTVPYSVTRHGGHSADVNSEFEFVNSIPITLAVTTTLKIRGALLGDSATTVKLSGNATPTNKTSVLYAIWLGN